MNMAGMNAAAGGGPVGGGMMMMNNTGSPAISNGTSNPDLRLMLNTYIYEYFLKQGHYDIARALVKEEKFDIRTNPKQSPSRRKDGDMNGADAELMDMDGKDDIPDDLPRPSNIADSGHQSSGFLFEWFAVFTDIFSAHRGQNKMGAANQYLIQHQQMQRMRENQQNQNLARPGMMPNQYAAQIRANQARTNMVNGDMNKQRLTPQQLAALQQNSQKANMQQHAAGRGEQTDGDINARPGTPGDGEGGASPSKRQRLDGQQQFNGGMMPNGRPGMPAGGQQGMMIQASFNPAMNAQFRPNGGMPPKAMAANMAAANGMMNMANAGSPMMPAMSQFSEAGINPEMYGNRATMGQTMQAGPNGPSGNHALQDYQMQLMLLEQQNKKRLMMARQEQNDSTNPRDGAMPGAGNMPPGMSPSGSRTGTSPNPTDQMKRTPQIGGMPGSPSAGDMQGRSPANMQFMQGDYNPAMFMKEGQPMMGPGPPNMRPPPTSVQPQANRIGHQFQGGQPMAQQPSQGQPQPVGTPGQRNSEMPPPPGPTANNSAQRNNQAASPANSNAPPTPQQSNKSNPAKAKKREDGNKKRPQKKNSTANAPNSEDNPAATPTSSAPITPIQNNSFGNANAKGPGAGPQQSNQSAQQNPQMQPNQTQMSQPDLGQVNYPDFQGPDQNFNLDFSTLENTDVLENFDFDSFLNTSAEDTFNFDGGMGGVDLGFDNAE